RRDPLTLAAGLHSGEVVLWDATDWKRLGREALGDHSGTVADLDFSADGKALAVASDSSGVLIWDFDLESWKVKAGKLANRNLTKREWEEFIPGRTYRKTFEWLPQGDEEGRR